MTCLTWFSTALYQVLNNFDEVNLKFDKECNNILMSNLNHNNAYNIINKITSIFIYKKRYQLFFAIFVRMQ